MNDQAKFERMLKILLLLSGGIRYSIAELTEKIEVSKRTVYRYLSTFRNVGFIVERKNSLYWIEEVKPPFKDLSELLHFTEEEAYILSRAIHSIDENNLLKEKLVEKLYSLYKLSAVAETIVKKENSITISNLTNGINTKKQVILRNYHSSHGKLIRDRLVEPFEFTTGFISVWAYDPESRSNKTFKTARILSVEVTDNCWQYENDHKKLPLDVFRISNKEQISVKLKLNLRAYNLLIEEYPLAEKFIIKKDDKTYYFDSWVCSFEGVGRFIMGLCEDIEVLKPKELRNYVKEKAKCLLK